MLSKVTAEMFEADLDQSSQELKHTLKLYMESEESDEELTSSSLQNSEIS